MVKTKISTLNIDELVADEHTPTINNSTSFLKKIEGVLDNFIKTGKPGEYLSILCDVYNNNDSIYWIPAYFGLKDRDKVVVKKKCRKKT